MISGEALEYERQGSKEFVPALQPDIFREGSVENNHILMKKKTKERKELLYTAADECTKFIQKN